MLDSECFRVLGLGQNAPEPEIKRAYRRMVKELHPDTGIRPDNVAFSRVVEAYHSLSSRGFGSRIIDFPLRRNKSPDYRAATATRTTRRTAASKSKMTSPAELGELLRKGKTPVLRAFAAMRLGNTMNAANYSYLREGLKDSDDQVVLAAVSAIGKIRAQAAGVDLILLFNHSDSRIKLAILDTIERMPNRFSYRSVISAGMQDDFSSVRRRSLQIFKTIGR